MTGTNTFVYKNVVFPAGPAYKNISEFDVTNPFEDIPYSTNLVGAYFLSSQMLNPLNNHANLGVPLLKIGTPTIGDKFSSCSDSNYFDTQLTVNSGPATIIVVAKNPSTTVDSWAVSNYTGNNSVGSDSILLRKDKQMEVYTSNGSALASTVVNLADAGSAGDLLICGGLFGPTSVTGSAYRPTLDNVLSGSRDVTRALTANRTYAIGTRPGMTGSGTPDVSAVLIYKERLNDANFLSVVQYLKKVFGARYNLWS